MNYMKSMKDELANPELTCVAFLENDEIYRSSKRGIAPIMEQLKSDENYFKNAYIGDKVIGKAAALLFVKAGIKELYTNVISEHARKVLEQYSIPVEYAESVSYIINRTGDGMCPMEEAVLHMEDPEEAYVILNKKMESMKEKHI